jgi:hypothetical protein
MNWFDKLIPTVFGFNFFSTEGVVMDDLEELMDRSCIGVASEYWTGLIRGEWTGLGKSDLIGAWESNSGDEITSGNVEVFLPNTVLIWAGAEMGSNSRDLRLNTDDVECVFTSPGNAVALFMRGEDDADDGFDIGSSLDNSGPVLWSFFSHFNGVNCLPFVGSGPNDGLILLLFSDMFILIEYCLRNTENRYINQEINKISGNWSVYY